MKRRMAGVLTLLVAAAPGAWAQFNLGRGGYQKHSFSVGGGGGALQRFDRIDTNRDGRISPDERSKQREQRKAMRGQQVG